MIHFAKAPDAYAQRILNEQKRRQAYTPNTYPSKAQIEALREYIRQFHVKK